MSEITTQNTDQTAALVSETGLSLLWVNRSIARAMTARATNTAMVVGGKPIAVFSMMSSEIKIARVQPQLIADGAASSPLTFIEVAVSTADGAAHAHQQTRGIFFFT